MDLDQLWTVYQWPPDRNLTVRANFVQSLDGNVIGPDGLSGSLSSAADRQLFRLLRAQCDAIVVGAETVRKEQYQPVTIRPELQPLRGDRPPPELVIISRGESPVDFPATVTTLDGLPDLIEQRGWHNILAEGGPSVVSQMWQRGLLHQIALTITPAVGGRGHLFGDEFTPWLRLLHTHAHDNTVFTLWDVE